MATTKRVSLTKIMRILHRDIGFFVVGLTIVYAVSGIMLTYRDTEFLKSQTLVEKSLAPGLPANQLGRILHLKDIQVVSEDENEIVFTAGSYDKKTGGVSYLSNEIPAVLQALNKLHFVSSKDSRHWFTTLYAVTLLFLALSSFWMYNSASPFFKRGIVTTFSGFVVSFLLLIL